MRDFKLGITLAAVAAGFAVASCDGAGEQAANEDPTRVETDSGVLVGALEQDDVVTFKGVPFAQAPVGELRWRAPQPITWEGERTATEFALPCPQPVNEDGVTANGGGVFGETSEDCLYLNVWAPADAEGAPVMMWLYGGAGYLGAGHLGSYQGYSFAKNDVILVTINYRLGALGNFAHPALAEGEQGSFAMMDSIAGLQWIQDNIEQFGGDPNNVTLFGQSAGGALVSNLLASPAAEGLFHKAIIHSGTSLDGGRSLEESEARGAEIATTLGLNGADATAEEIRAISPDQFTGNADIRSGVTGVNDGTIRVGSLREAIENGTAHDVPLIVGSNSGEGGADRSNELVNLAADGAPAWQYYFGYVPEWRAAEWTNGAIHSAELMFAFNSTDTSSWGGEQTTDEDRAVAARVHSCWVAFAHMDPSSQSISCADGFEWQARTEENDAVAVFGATPELAEMSTVMDDIEARRSAQAGAVGNAG
jgi:para-nitrobenzyl esterase